MASKIDGTNGLLQNYVYLDGTTTPSIVTAFSYTIPSGIQTVLLNPPATFGSGTVILPANPVDGMTVTISTTRQITSFTVSPSAGQTIDGGYSATPLQFRQTLSYVYNSSKTTWYAFTSINPYRLPTPSTSGNLLVSDGTIWNSTAASGVAAGIGVGQTWQDLTGSRSNNTNYTNSTGKSIYVSVITNTATNAPTNSMTINGIVVYLDVRLAPVTRNWRVTVGGIVPPGGTYSVSLEPSIASWLELR